MYQSQLQDIESQLFKVDDLIGDINVWLRQRDLLDRIAPHLPPTTETAGNGGGGDE